jgi:sulfhydrogenase subunit gamma (sulfur reductase)
MSNIYKPSLMIIEDVIWETPDTTTFRLNFTDENEKDAFYSKYRVGQFGMYSAFGHGESTFCVASPPTRRDYIECTYRATGKNTKALQALNPGDTIGFRGSYGNWFPIEEWKGKNLLFIAGGIALPPLRSVIWNILDLRADYSNVTIIYGARTVDDLVYKRELDDWQNRKDVTLVKTVDPGGETPDWDGKIGFVPTVLDQTAPSPDNTIAIVCGPPIMIKFTFPVLDKLGFEKDAVYTTLENRMKCGVGKCGRCNVGGTYVCKDGPVFRWDVLAKLPAEF